MLLAFQFFCAHGSMFDELIRNFESGANGVPLWFAPVHEHRGRTPFHLNQM